MSFRSWGSDHKKRWISLRVSFFQCLGCYFFSCLLARVLKHFPSKAKWWNCICGNDQQYIHDTLKSCQPATKTEQFREKGKERILAFGLFYVWGVRIASAQFIASAKVREREWERASVTETIPSMSTDSTRHFLSWEIHFSNKSQEKNKKNNLNSCLNVDFGTSEELNMCVQCVHEPLKFILHTLMIMHMHQFELYWRADCESRTFNLMKNCAPILVFFLFLFWG